MLHSVKCRIERAFIELKLAVGRLPHPLRDGVSILRPPRQCLENDNVEGALDEFDIGLAHDSPIVRLGEHTESYEFAERRVSLRAGRVATLDSAALPSVRSACKQQQDEGRKVTVTYFRRPRASSPNAFRIHFAEDYRFMFMSQTAGAWTLADLARLPDDGNRYELVDGELFVTPAPSPAHESLALKLRAILEPYVRSQQLGEVITPRSVVRRDGSEVEPDLMVRPTSEIRPKSWEEMPIPTLVVEVISQTSRSRDLGPKRAFYLRNGVAEYWIVDRSDRTIRIVTPNDADLITSAPLRWRPSGASEALTFDVASYFRDALD